MEGRILDEGRKKKKGINEEDIKGWFSVEGGYEGRK